MSIGDAAEHDADCDKGIEDVSIARARADGDNGAARRGSGGIPSRDHWDLMVAGFR